MLAGQGFGKIFNLSGGIKAWNGGKAVGPVDLGLDLFSGGESAEQTLAVAYTLEQGLREYYLAMATALKDENTQNLFLKLADIEIRHQEKILEEYGRITDTRIARDDFEKDIVVRAVEGGMTQEEFARTYQLDTESPREVIGLAMAIEAQALDLYLRAADHSTNPATAKTLGWMASEEQAHLVRLGELMETTVAEDR